MERNWLFIPCYNCQKQVARVIDHLNEFSNLHEFEKIILIDNQSLDATQTVIMEKLAKVSNPKQWVCVENEHNCGLGGSHKVAFSLAIQHGIDWIAVLHGDDQAHVEDLSLFLSARKDGPDALLGSRFSRKSKRIGYQKRRIVGNFFLNCFYSLLTGQVITDLGSGLNFYQVKTLQKIPFQEFSNGFDFNAELLLNLLRVKARVLFLPTSWFETDQVSNAKNFRVAFQLLKTLIRFRLWSYLRPYFWGRNSKAPADTTNSRIKMGSLN